VKKFATYLAILGISLLHPLPAKANCLASRTIVNYYQYPYGCQCQIGPCGPHEYLAGTIIYECDGTTTVIGDTSCGTEEVYTEECPPCG